ncbi:MAG: hypothetical protein WC480_05095 [Patescibacteria group bacterium]
MANLSKKSLILCGLILALSFGLFGCAKKSTSAVNQNKNVSANATTTEEIDTSNWKTYFLNETSGPQFKYPPELFVVRNNAFNINFFENGTNQSQIVISLGPGSDETSQLNEKYAVQQAIGHCTMNEQTINIDCQQVASAETVIINSIHGYRVVLNKKIKNSVSETTLEIPSMPYYYLDLIDSSGHHIIISVWSNPELFNNESNANYSYIKQIIDKIVSTIHY